MIFGWRGFSTPVRDGLLVLPLPLVTLSYRLKFDYFRLQVAQPTLGAKKSYHFEVSTFDLGAKVQSLEDDSTESIPIFHLLITRVCSPVEHSTARTFQSFIEILEVGIPWSAHFACTFQSYIPYLCGPDRIRFISSRFWSKCRSIWTCSRLLILALVVLKIIPILFSGYGRDLVSDFPKFKWPPKIELTALQTLVGTVFQSCLFCDFCCQFLHPIGQFSIFAIL